ncbi:pirin family protein [Pseudomonas shirazica]|uniref:pirin family protein n=1 Tax=Pseudomonas shirazica TaxID=1940636 RepID=UPI0022AB35A0|nr:pirin family protein [Pseudomonas shirazica]
MLQLRPFESLGPRQPRLARRPPSFLRFAEYYDPARMHWGNLRVWNDDLIAAGSGFPPHPHRDMEIITYVREGAISHQDSLGNKGRTEAGDVQVMSAGTGHRAQRVQPGRRRHAYFPDLVVPERTGEAPQWGSRPFPKGERGEGFVTLASGRAGDEDSLQIRTDARLVAATLRAGETAEYRLDAARRGYLVPAKGLVEVNGLRAKARDGVAIEQEEVLRVTAIEDSEIVLVDVA